MHLKRRRSHCLGKRTFPSEAPLTLFIHRSVAVKGKESTNFKFTFLPKEMHEYNAICVIAVQKAILLEGSPWDGKDILWKIPIKVSALFKAKFWHKGPGKLRPLYMACIGTNSFWPDMHLQRWVSKGRCARSGWEIKHLLTY